MGTKGAVEVDSHLLEKADAGRLQGVRRLEHGDFGSPRRHLGLGDVHRGGGPHPKLGPREPEVEARPLPLLLRDAHLLGLAEHLDVTLRHLEDELGFGSRHLRPRGDPIRLGLAGREKRCAVDVVAQAQEVVREDERRLVREAELLRGQASEHLLTGALPREPKVRRGRWEERAICGSHVPVRYGLIVSRRLEAGIVRACDLDGLFQAQGYGHDFLRGRPTREEEHHSQGGPAQERSSQHVKPPYDLDGVYLDQASLGDRGRPAENAHTGRTRPTPTRVCRFHRVRDGRNVRTNTMAYGSTGEDLHEPTPLAFRRFWRTRRRGGSRRRVLPDGYIVLSGNLHPEHPVLTVQPYLVDGSCQGQLQVLGLDGAVSQRDGLHGGHAQHALRLSARPRMDDGDAGLSGPLVWGEEEVVVSEEAIEEHRGRSR